LEEFSIPLRTGFGTKVTISPGCKMSHWSGSEADSSVSNESAVEGKLGRLLWAFTHSAYRQAMLRETNSRDALSSSSYLLHLIPPPTSYLLHRFDLSEGKDVAKCRSHLLFY
jgi:hypothetical protein